MSAAKLSENHPSGCYLGFNAAVDRKAAEQLVMLVNDLKKNDFSSVNICMSSIGGLLDHAYYAFNMLEAIDIKIITWNVGNIQSASNMLYLCGDERYAVSGSTFFFHQTGYDPPSGRITEPYLVERLKAVQYDDHRSAQIIASKTGRPINDVRGWQNTELVMDTTNAISHGIVHEVRPLRIPPDAFFLQVVI